MASSERGLNITDLPPEIHTMILNSCPYQDHIALRQSSNIFRHLPVDKTAILFNTESTKHPSLPSINRFPCYTCHKIPVTYHFPDAELRGDRVRGGRLATTRMCLLCARANNVIRPGDPVMYQRCIHHLCLTCGQFCSFYLSSSFRCYPVPITVPAYGSAQAQQWASDYNLWVHRTTTFAGMSQSCTAFGGL